MSKWTMRRPSEVLVGTLERVYVPSGFFADSDTNLVVTPGPEHRGLLVNRKGRRNGNFRMECEVQVSLQWRALFNKWASSMLHTPITLSGVYVDDDGHDSRTELHPVDLLAGRVDLALTPHDPTWWVTRRATDRGLKLGTTLFAYRFLAATDTRDGLFFAGPPLAGSTRTAWAELDFPERPAPEWRPYVANHIEVIEDADVGDTVVGSGADRRVRIEVTCKAVGHGGPGVVIGEAAAYWKNPAVPEIVVEPTTLAFGQVIPFKTATKTIAIRNVGVAPLVVSVDAAPAGAVFTWDVLSNVVIPDGGKRELTVTFRPRQGGGASARWSVQTNDALGPRSVALSGTGRDVTPQ